MDDFEMLVARIANDDDDDRWKGGQIPRRIQIRIEAEGDGEPAENAHSWQGRSLGERGQRTSGEKLTVLDSLASADPLSLPSSPPPRSLPADDYFTVTLHRWSNYLDYRAPFSLSVGSVSSTFTHFFFLRSFARSFARSYFFDRFKWREIFLFLLFRKRHLHGIFSSTLVSQLVCRVFVFRTGVTGKLFFLRFLRSTIRYGNYVRIAFRITK